MTSTHLAKGLTVELWIFDLFSECYDTFKRLSLKLLFDSYSGCHKYVPIEFRFSPYESLG